MTASAPQGTGTARSWIATLLAVLIGGALGAGGGILVALTRPVSYRATVQEYIRFPGDGATPDPAGPQKVRSYAGMVRSQRVLDPVITAQGLSLTVPELADKVTAVNPEGSLSVEISVTDERASRASGIADAIGKQFALSVRQLEGQTTVPEPGQSETTVGGLTTTVVPAVTVTEVNRSQPRKVSGPRWPWIVGGLMLGVLLGAGAGRLSRRRDPWLDEPSDLVALIGSAPLGVVDDPRGGRRGSGGTVTAARAIAANLRFSDVDHPPRCLVIAGPYADGPQTAVAVDLAVGLARTGQRVVLVEADLADTRLRGYLRLDGRTGLTSILTGDLDLDQVLVDWRDGVQVLPGGPLPPNPAQVMRSEQLASLLRVLKVRFDYVLLDGPPVLATPVAAELAARADGAVLVLTRGELRAGEVTDAVAALERADARLLGTIFCDAAGREGLRRGPAGWRGGDPEREPAAGRAEARTADGPQRRQASSGSAAARRSLQDFDDPSIVPLLLASPDEIGREAEALPRSSADRGAPHPETHPAGYPGTQPMPVYGEPERDAPLFPQGSRPAVPSPRQEWDEEPAAAPDLVTLPDDPMPEDPFSKDTFYDGGYGADPAGHPAGHPSGYPSRGNGSGGSNGHGYQSVAQAYSRYPGSEPSGGSAEQDRPAAAEYGAQQARQYPGPYSGQPTGQQTGQQTAVADEHYPQLIQAPAPSPAPSPAPTYSPLSGPTPVVSRPSMAPQPSRPVTAPTPPVVDPAAPPARSAAPAAAVMVPPPAPLQSQVLPTVRPAPTMPTAQPTPSATPTPSAHALPQALQGHPALLPSTYPMTPAAGRPIEPAAPAYPQSWPELRREYEEPRPAYLDDPDLERPYQPVQPSQAHHGQPLPRRAAEPPAYPPQPHAQPHTQPYVQPQQAGPQYGQPPSHQPLYPQPVDDRGFDELPLPRRTLPQTARPGMTVVPGAPSAPPPGRRRAREDEPEPVLDTAPRPLPWAEDQDDDYGYGRHTR